MADDTRNLDPNAVALTSGGKSSRLVRSGDIIGDSYRIKSLIGKGGMGYVFRAEHLIMGNDYALKMLAPDQINEVTWNRFQAEGKAIARLDHTNIVKIYNMGVDQGQYPYYVMDLLDGVSLSDCIEDKLPLSLDDVLDMFIQLATGFGYAHSRGIIHRDVKPSNVVLVDSGGRYPTAKIVDFGIAKLVGNGTDFHAQSQTATGEVFGSPFYMSPEQCLGNDIDHRADIYSLGCTLFEALCGSPPFVGQTAMATVLMHQSKPSPTLESVSGKYWTEEMEALVAKMLMKRPADRYQSMDQVRHDLERIQQHKAVGKNVDTGFASSMESQLGDIEAKYEEEQAGSGRRTKILVAVGLLVAGCAAYAAYTVFTAAARKVPLAPVTLGASYSKVTAAEIPKMHAVEAPAIAKAKLVLDATKTISSQIDKTTGARVFTCPDFDMGILTWWSGPRTLAGVDTDIKDDGWVYARGRCSVPAGKPIFLKLDMGRNRETINNPGFVAKFGQTELNGLMLTCEAAVEEFGDEEFKVLARDRVNAIIDAADGWKNLEYIDFYHVGMTHHVLDVLDKHPTIRRFLGREASIDSAYLAKKHFIRGLSSIELANTSDSVDPVLEALKGSTALKNVYVCNATLSAKGIIALATCPNLIMLYLDNVDMDDDALVAIHNIKTLRRLKLGRCRASLAAMPVFLKFKNIEVVDLDLLKWRGEDKQKLWALMPNADPRKRLQLNQASKPAPAP